jgi:serine/threonine protein kinase
LSVSLLAPHTLIQERYQLVRLIGQGGMGAVYEAFDLRLNTTVALKQILLTDSVAQRAFAREAQLLATLRHPGLPKVSDYFHALGSQFLAMEFIPGTDLAALLHQQQHAFQIETVLAWADTLLDVVEYLHAHTPPVIHRDIKPQNLKCTPQGAIMLLDFGLAKGSLAAGPQGLSATSMYGYTLPYAPLEQLQGTGTDARSDLYAVGATLYRLLTNVPPVDALTRATAHIAGQPDPLQPVTMCVPAAPEELNALILQAMALAPQERPASATSMRLRLQQIGTDSERRQRPTVVGGMPRFVVAPSIQNRPAPLARISPSPLLDRAPGMQPQRFPPWRSHRIRGGVLGILIILLCAIFGQYLLAQRAIAPVVPDLVAQSGVRVPPTASAVAANALIAPPATPAVTQARAPTPVAQPSLGVSPTVSAVAANALAAPPATPALTDGPAPTPVDGHRIIRLDSVWRHCPSYVVPDTFVLDPNPTKAIKQLETELDHIMQDWQRGPDFSGVDGPYYELDLTLTSITTGRERIRLNSTAMATVRRVADVPPHMHIFDPRGCGSGGTLRYFAPVALNAQRESYRQRTTNTDGFDYFSLQPGEFEVFVFPFICRGPGIYRVDLEVGYSYQGQPSKLQWSSSGDTFCPNAFTLWEWGKPGEQFRWNGTIYEKQSQ